MACIISLHLLDYQVIRVCRSVAVPFYYTYIIETVCNILSVKKYLQKNYILARLTKTMFKGYIFDKHSTTSQAPPPNLNTNEIPDSPYQTVYIMSQNKFHAILF